jgi:hypothetical protein
MKKSAWTLGAFVVFVGLLVWVVTHERGRVPEKEEIFRGEIARAEDISRIEVVKYTVVPAPTTPGPTANAEAGPSGAVTENALPGPAPGTTTREDRLVIERRGDEWYLTQPVQGLADPDTVKNMVKAIVELKPGVRENIQPTAKEFGLDHPNMAVIAHLKNGKQIKITLGADTPVGSKVYATISDKKGLYLVPTYFKTDMDKKPEALRDKKLARFDRDKVKRVTFINEKGTVEAVKEKDARGKTKWKIIKPGVYKGDEISITSSFGKVADVEAKDFAPNPNDLKAYGLDKPRAQCRIETEDGKVYEILVGNQTTAKVKISEYTDTTETKDLVYAMRKGRPEVLMVENTLFTDLNKDLMALRDKRILEFTRDDVLSLKVERRQGVNFSVMRARDEWKLQTPEVATADKYKVEDIISDLVDMEAREYLEKAPDLRSVGLVAPQAAITVNLRGGKSVVIKFGDEAPGTAEKLLYCQLSTSTQMYKVTDQVLRALPLKIEDIKQGATPKLGIGNSTSGSGSSSSP